MFEQAFSFTSGWKTYACIALYFLARPILTLCEIDPGFISQVEYVILGLGTASMRHAIKTLKDAASDPIAEMRKKSAK